MRRQRRSPRYYYASSLFDGTVLAAYPIRKPAPKIIKRDNLKIDDDGVCEETLRSGKHVSDCQYENRFRSQNIIANRLNARRAIREIILPELATIQQEITTVRTQLDHIEHILRESKKPYNIPTR
jgi:hypothetical protein